MDNKKDDYFENIYQKSNNKTTNQDKVELLSNFINKLKQVINQGQFIVKELEYEIKK
jgi:hypothetical protein